MGITFADIGGRKFAAFVAATVSMVCLYGFGFELSHPTLDAIVAMYVAFAAGNGVEHVAMQFGRRVQRPEVTLEVVQEAIVDLVEAMNQGEVEQDDEEDQ